MAISSNLIRAAWRMKQCAFGILLTSLSISHVSAQDVQRNIGGLALSKDQPIQLEGDALDINDSKAQAILSGNVKVVQGDTQLKAGKMVVNYIKSGQSGLGASSDIRTIEVSGSVLLQSGTQTATASYGIFNLVNETLELTGDKVVLSDGDNVFVGCSLKVSMASGDAKLARCKNERVIIQLDPKSRPQ